MARQKETVTKTELAILECLWSRERARIRDIAESLYGNYTSSQYATVQSLLERLEKKGFVRRDRSSHAHQFSPNIERPTFLGQQLQEIADKVCDGSLTPLLLTLAEKVQLSDEERQQLLRLIDEEAPPLSQEDR